MIDYNIIKERVEKYYKSPNFKCLEIYKNSKNKTPTLRVKWRTIDTTPYITNAKYEELLEICKKLQLELKCDIIDSTLIPEYITLTESKPQEIGNQIKIGTLIENKITKEKEVIVGFIGYSKEKVNMIKIGKNIISSSEFKEKYIIIDNIKNYINSDYVD